MTTQDRSTYKRVTGHAAVMAGTLLACFVVAACPLASESTATDLPDNTPRLAAAPPPSAPTAQVPLNVSIGGFAFAPDAVTVSPGQPIIWTNTDPVPHTVTSTEKHWDSGVIRAGESYRLSLDRPGTYTYYCAIHPHMTAKIVVR